VERSILGNEQTVCVPADHLRHPIELLAYGIVGIIVSLVFCKSLLGARRLFMELPPWTRAWQL
jgi:hypothetical protein